MKFRSSFTGKWLDCPARAFNEPRHTNASMAAGTLCHEFLKCAAEGKDDIFEPARGPYLEGAAEDPEHNCVPPEEVLELRKITMAFLEKNPLPDRILGIEWQWGKDGDPPVYVAPSKVHQWHGTIDLVYIDNRGRLVVRDYKCGRSKYDASTSLQLRVYAAAAFLEWEHKLEDVSEIILEYAIVRSNWISRSYVTIPELREYLVELDHVCDRIAVSQWSAPLEAPNANCGYCLLREGCATLKELTDNVPEVRELKGVPDSELSDEYVRWKGVSAAVDALKKKARDEVMRRFHESGQKKKKFGRLSMTRHKTKAWPAEPVLEHLLAGGTDMDELLRLGCIKIGAQAVNKLAKVDTELAKLADEKLTHYVRVGQK